MNIPSDDPVGPVTVYGLSSEGYQIGVKLASKGHRVSVIDETLGSAIILSPGIASDYPDLKSLLAEEPLLELRTLKECVKEAAVVFFCPKLRRRDEVLSEVKSRLVEVGKHLEPGTLIVFCLPLGISGMKSVVERLEHGSGLVEGKDFLFCYSPLDQGKPATLGCDHALGIKFEILEKAGFALEISSVAKAELLHCQHLVAKYSNLASALEAAKRLTLMGVDSPREYKQIFVDELAASLYDLRLVVESVDTGDPFLYLSSGSLKSVDSYTRFLVDRIRDAVRTKDLKAARLKIILLTDSDPHEMRGDKIGIATALRDRLQDFFSDIEYMNVMKDTFSFPVGVEKTILLVFLSGSCEQKVTQLFEEQITLTKSHIVRANLPAEVLF